MSRAQTADGRLDVETEQPAGYHDDLVSRYIDMLEQQLSDPETRSRMIGVRVEYAEHADTADETIVSFALRRAVDGGADGNTAEIDMSADLTRLRAKLMLVLHGSGSYDVARVRARLEAMDELFIEKAIVYGRVSRPSRNRYGAHASGG